jgi:hypothetical protein
LIVSAVWPPFPASAGSDLAVRGIAQSIFEI